MRAVLDNADLYWAGFRATLGLAVLSGAVALALGAGLAALRVSPIPPLRGLGTAYVEIVRNTPLTVVFFFTVFVLPQLDVTIAFFASAVVALSSYTAAFVCAAVRSGINSVGVGQAEAARSIGLTFPQVLRYVVLPQALRTVIPPLVDVLIALAKNTPVAGCCCSRWPSRSTGGWTPAGSSRPTGGTSSPTRRSGSSSAASCSRP